MQYFIAFVHYFLNGIGLNFASTKNEKNMESTGTAMNYIALQQAIQGKMIMIGGDLFTGTAKPKLYGTFYHPHLLIGMPSMGGDVKVYIDAV